MGEVSVCMCERDRVVKMVRRGGSRKPDGCLITCLAIWTVVTELLNLIHQRKCMWMCLCECEMESNCFSACTRPHFPGLCVDVFLYIIPHVAQICEDANKNIAIETNIYTNTHTDTQACFQHFEGQNIDLHPFPGELPYP